MPRPPRVSRPVARDLARQVERRDRAATLLHGSAVEQVGGHEPDHLELEAVRVLGVQALGRPVVGGADEGIGAGQCVGEVAEVGERRDLPREVVEPDRAATGWAVTGLAAHAEERDVVVIGRARRLQERALTAG